MLRLAGILCACFFAAASPVAMSDAIQQKPERGTFRSGVELVEVDVVAVDAVGRPVLDLRQEEFDVYEDGRPRELVSFSRVHLPGADPHEPPLTDVSTNEGSFDGRLFFLVLDDANSSRNSTEGIAEAARDLVSRLAPQDRVGMLWVSQKKEGAREITSNHATIVHALSAFQAERSTIERRAGPAFVSPLDRRPPRLDVDEDVRIDTLRVQRDTGPQDLKQFFDTLRPFTIVRDVSRYLAGLPHRRKAVVYLGEALRPLGPRATRAGVGEYADLELQKAVTEARRANVSVYLLDPRSPLRSGTEELVEAHDTGPLERLRSGDFSALADTTGGFAASSPLLRTQIDRILLETGAYYLLGYYAYPPEPKSSLARLKSALNPWEGFRHIEVRTSRPGVRTRARKGYWPIEPDTAAAGRSQPSEHALLLSTVSGVLPRPDLRLRAFAAPFRGSRGTHPVLLAMEVQDHALRLDKDGGFEDTLDAVVVAVEPGEKVRLTKKVTAMFALPPGRAHALEQGRYLFASAVDLPPGQYQLRIGLHSSRSNRMGSVYHEVTVPDFSRPVSMSGIVITQTTGGPSMPVARSQTAHRFATVLPTLGREFSSTARALASVHVYRTGAARSSSISVSTTIQRRGSDSAVWTSGEPVSSWRADEGGYQVDLPLSDLGPGEYRLTIRAQDSRGDFTEQQLDFAVNQF